MINIAFIGVEKSGGYEGIQIKKKGPVSFPTGPAVAWLCL
jgi:hypothetical protein